MWLKIDLRLHFWQPKQNIPFGGSNFSHLYFSNQFFLKFHSGNLDFSSLNWSFSGSASSFALDISAVSSLCCCPKNAESLLCFDITLHSQKSREGLSIKYMDLHNQLPITFIQTSAGERQKIEPLTLSYSLDFGSCFTFNLLKFRPNLF